ncbi:hypothetical protein KFK09_025386 [Dendrobium nobile]|uniref:Uncharacterized protein n=1 Tax=Dendrobium nobile TaxID=94219 RepID=A0A8T3AF93_DENNO|nr:hypothetical protein KFK09_025386 [Dendrobium nobile]
MNKSQRVKLRLLGSFDRTRVLKADCSTSRTHSSISLALIPFVRILEDVLEREREGERDTTFGGNTNKLFRFFPNSYINPRPLFIEHYQGVITCMSKKA